MGFNPAKSPDMKVIGLDPAFRKNGFGCCVLDVKRNKIEAVNFQVFADFKAFLVFISMKDHAIICQDDRIIWGVENSNLQNQTFGRYQSGAKGLNKISRNIGANQAVSQITVDVLKWHFGDNNVLEFSPQQKGAKWNLYEAQSMLFDLKVPTSKIKMNQDERDALKIAILTLEKAKLLNII